MDNRPCVAGCHAVTVQAPVKINLALHVTGQRADGYHRIESLVVFSPEGDVVTVEKAAHDSFCIEGPFAAQLTGAGDNLVIRARDGLRAASANTIGPVAICLQKNLPVASGLGGGSADAAATLVALDTLMPSGLDAERLLPCALQLGADVPMCLAGIRRKCALMARGIGEEITGLPDFPALHMVLLNPGIAMATPAVFAALQSRSHAPLAEDLGEACSFADLTAKLHKARNDLYPSARRLAPELDHVLHILTRSGAALARMSGSGATCFGLYPSAAAARAAAQSIAACYPGFFVKETMTYGKKFNKPH